MKQKMLFIVFFFVTQVFCSAQSIDSVYAYIQASGIKHPRLVMKQAILETGWFKSPYLMKRNNLFAFRHKKEYMRFGTWQQSVDYYKNWQDRHYVDYGENYLSFLTRIKYAQSPKYIQTLKQIKFP